MARCYEFGVTIESGSDQAMVVAPEGGYCLCPDTGVTCHGRFAGCDAITSQAGRIPPSAPPWTVSTAASIPEPTDGAARPPATDETDLPEGARSSTVVADRIDLRDADLDTPGPDIAALLDELRGEIGNAQSGSDGRIAVLEQRLEDLALTVATTDPSIDQIVDHLGQLTDQVRALSSDYRDLLATLARRHEEVQSAVSEVAHVTQAIRRDISDLAASHRRDIVALRRQIIEAPPAADPCATPFEAVLREELRDIRRAIDAVADRSPSHIVTASQLAETINTMRGAGLEQISAAHLVQSIHDEVRAIVERAASNGGDPTPDAVIRSYP